MHPPLRMIGSLVVLTGCLITLFGSDVRGHAPRTGYELGQMRSGKTGGSGLVRLASLSLGEREEIVAIARTKPTIDLEIRFQVDSEVLSESSMPAIEALGRALTSPELAGTTFLIAGHTDGIESEEYSQILAELRADAVKYELVTRFGVPEADLVTVGYGSSKLKDPLNPFAASNDRVQIVSMAR